MFKKIALSLCFSLFLGLLSSCSPSGSLRLKDGESKTEKSTENQKNSESADNTIGAPVALPPNFGDEPPKPGEIGNNAFMPNGMPALQPMKGINVDELFSEEIKDSDDRFNRLENAVLEMRKEFESVKPSIVRLAAVESDIQSLVKEMEVMLQETPPSQNAPFPEETEATLEVEQLDPQPKVPEQEPENQALTQPPPPTPNPTQKLETGIQQEGQSLKKPDASSAPQDLTQKESPVEVTKKEASPEHILRVPPKTVEQKNPPQTYDGIVAKNIRIGEHDDKIRVVLDTNQKTPFSVELDNEEKLIIVELPDARWVGAAGQKFPDSALLESYSVEPTNGGKGTMIVLSLKKTTDILKQSTLMPDENPSHRIYFDLRL